MSEAGLAVSEKFRLGGAAGSRNVRALDVCFRRITLAAL